MDISVQSVSHGQTSTNKVKWVRVRGRGPGNDIGRVLDSSQTTAGLAERVLFDTGEIATFLSSHTEDVPPPR